MKIVFLDIDGVLNCNATKDMFKYKGSNTLGIEQEKVQLLRQIIDKTDATIVLTSTWKDGWGVLDSLCDESGEYLNKQLAKEGLEIFCKTEDLTMNRGEGINKFLKDFSMVTSYVILDDYLFEDFKMFDLTNNLVLINECIGLQQEDVFKAISILNM